MAQLSPFDDIEVISIELTALTDRFAWAPDTDIAIVGCSASAGGWFVSRDSSRSKSSLQTPTTQTVGRHWILATPTTVGIFQLGPVLVRKGEFIYFSSSSAGCLLLYCLVLVS